MKCVPCMQRRMEYREKLLLPYPISLFTLNWIDIRYQNENVTR